MSNPNEKVGYWKRVWAKHPESMADNLNRLNESRKKKSSERMALLRAVLPQVPIGPLTSTELREAIREAWSSNYNEQLTRPAAWNLVRAGRSYGVLPTPGADGMYVVHPMPSQDE